MNSILNMDAGPSAMGIDVVSLVEGVAGWCQALQGTKPIRAGLETLAVAFGAGAASLVKAAHENQGALRAITVQPDERGSGRQGIDRALSDLVIGSYLPRAKVASVWFGSMAASAGEGVLDGIRRRTGFGETVVIVLAQDGKWAHLLELHFSHRLVPAEAALINSLAGTVAETWAQRAAGLFSEALLERRPERANIAMAAPILSDDNPAKLSRAEFRVCMLLSNGLSREAVLEELRISASTLRSHLRQVCAKTGCDTVNELMHRLLVAAHRPGMVARQAMEAMQVQRRLA